MLQAADGANANSNPTRAAFLKIIERPRVPPAPEVKSLAGINGLSEEHFMFAPEAGQRVPGILLKGAKEGRRPVVIALHGTGGKKENNLGILKELAGLGFIAVAIDARFHGERTRSGSGDAEYDDEIAQSWRTGNGHPFLYDTVWDVMRLIDYLETRPDVDASRIGLIGFSKGGMETYLAAAADPRIAVAVPCIGVQCFRWGLENDAWQARVGTIQKAVNAAAKDAGSKIDAVFAKKFFDRLVPGIYAEFDGPIMLTLITPRPLLVINGDSDANTPLTGLMECDAAARKAYHESGADEKYILRVEEKTAHAVNPAAHKAAIEWLTKWLAP